MDSLYIDTNLTYDPNTNLVNQPLKITNKSKDQLVFKIKTNQKNIVSMTINHGFIRPQQTISIQVKIVEKVQQNISIKLQVNWAKATEEIKTKNDSKMATVSKQNISKSSFSILRKVQPQKIKQPIVSQVQKEAPLTAISPPKFKVFQKAKPFLQDDLYSEMNSNQKKQQQQKKIPNIQIKKQEKPQIKKQQKDLFQSAIAQTQNLQIVAQQDEQDHQKEIQQIKNKQLEQRRKLDEIKVKVSRLNQQVKAKQIIKFEFLVLLIMLAFIFGKVLQNLIL